MYSVFISQPIRHSSRKPQLLMQHFVLQNLNIFWNFFFSYDLLILKDICLMNRPTILKINQKYSGTSCSQFPTKEKNPYCQIAAVKDIIKFCPSIQTLTKKILMEVEIPVVRPWDATFPFTLSHRRIFLVLLRDPIHSECRTCSFSPSPLVSEQVWAMGTFPRDEAHQICSQTLTCYSVVLYYINKDRKRDKNERGMHQKFRI